MLGCKEDYHSEDKDKDDSVEVFLLEERRGAILDQLGDLAHLTFNCFVALHARVMQLDITFVTCLTHLNCHNLVDVIEAEEDGQDGAGQDDLLLCGGWDPKVLPNFYALLRRC